MTRKGESRRKRRQPGTPRDQSPTTTPAEAHEIKDQSATCDAGKDGTPEPEGEDELFGENAEDRQFVMKRNLRKRIDVYLQERLKGISRSRVRKLIELGGVTINGKTPKPSTTAVQGDVINVILPAPAIRTIEPEEIPLHILYEDDHFIIINKQAGLLVHPARCHLSGTLLNARRGGETGLLSLGLL